MATRRIQEFLDGNHIRYAMIHHSPAFTASQVAESVHIPGRNLAKVVMVMISGELAMAVVPANRDVDLALLQKLAHQKDVRLAYEAEFADRFEGCQLGTVPPFGSLFGMDAYVDRSLMDASLVAFNAGTHRDVIVMRTDDFARLAQPKVVHIDADPIREQFAPMSI